MNNLDPIISLETAIEISQKNQAQLARLLGVSRQTVNDWKQSDGLLPPLYAHRFVKLFKSHFQNNREAS